MATMLGDRLLPDSVQTRRRKLRSRLQSAREPVRSLRERAVPGPDLVGKAERRARNLRNRVVTREGAVSRIKNMRSSGGNGESNGDSTNSGGNGSTL